MGTGFGGMEDYFHLYRAPQLIVLKGRDVISVLSDYIIGDFDSTCLLKGSNNATIYSSSLEKFKNKRVLMFSRTNVDELVNGVRVVPYVDSTGHLFPIIGANTPTIAFDRSANMLTLFFWCNMTDEFESGDDYDKDKVYESYKELPPSSTVWSWEIDKDNEKDVTRHMFIATGTIGHYFMSGWNVPIVPDAMKAKDNWDLVPLFQQPKSFGVSEDYDAMPPYPQYPKLYKAVADEDAGTIDVKAIKADGTLVEPTITFDVLSDA